MMNIPTWLSPRWNNGSKGTPLLLGIATLIVVVILYQLVLSTYVQNFIALNHSLKSQQSLLNNKTLRTQAIQELKNAQNEYITILEGINSHFFTDVEADLFIKGLPSTMSTIGNRVILFKPKPEPFKRTLADDLHDYVQRLNISTKERLLEFITEHRNDINANRDTQALQNQISKMIPESKREELQAIWSKTTTDPLEMANVNKLSLEIMIQGSYYELVEVLTYLKNMNKGLEIQQINVMTLKEGQLETSFLLDIYSVQTHE